MSFHHAQPRKNNTPGQCEPMGQPSKDINNQSIDGLSAVPGDDQLRTADYDDEARFELLSAYIDDEVTPEERHLVSQWLQNEPAIQNMYQHLLMLRQAIRTAPTPLEDDSPLAVPTPPKLFERTSFVTLGWALAGPTIIALLGSLIHFNTPQGHEQLKEAWQFLQTLPQKTLLEFASSTLEIPDGTSNESF